VSETPLDRDRDRIADVAIDRAVREIMSADPGPAFRQRVMARIGADSAAARRPWLSQLVVAAAVVVLAFAAILWMRRAPAPAPVSTSTTVAATPQAGAPTPTAPRPSTASSDSSASQSRVPVTPATTRRRASQVDLPVADAGANGPRMVEAASIETALVADVASQASVTAAPTSAAGPAMPDAVRLSEIALPPIVIKEIVLEPLPFGGR
jgi:cytoskeletal protein RodZ